MNIPVSFGVSLSIFFFEVALNNTCRSNTRVVFGLLRLSFQVFSPKKQRAARSVTSEFVLRLIPLIMPQDN